MKTRIIGFVFVAIVLGALYLLIDGDPSLPASRTATPLPSSSSDADFKNLKIQ